MQRSHLLKLCVSKSVTLPHFDLLPRELPYVLKIQKVSIYFKLFFELLHLQQRMSLSGNLVVLSLVMTMDRSSENQSLPFL